MHITYCTVLATHTQTFLWASLFRTRTLSSLRGHVGKCLSIGRLLCPVKWLHVQATVGCARPSYPSRSVNH